MRLEFYQRDVTVERGHPETSCMQEQVIVQENS